VRIVAWLDVFFYRLAVVVARVCPRSLAYFLGDRLADLRRWTSPTSRHAVRSNLAHVFEAPPEPHELDRRTRVVFRNFARFVVDFLRLPEWDDARMAEKIEFHGGEHARKALARGRGIVFLTAHLGNWELGGALLAHLGIRLNVVARPHRAGAVTKMFDRRRERLGMRVISVREAARRAYRVLQAGEALAVLGDRDITHHGHRVRFFGEETTVPSAYVRMALRTNAAIVPGCLVRRSGDRFDMWLDAPVVLRRTGDEEADVEANLALCVAVLERFIRRHWEQWFVFEPLWGGEERA
jgi:KDO2-lipid IV(A) lauroyltransferase